MKRMKRLALWASLAAVVFLVAGCAGHYTIYGPTGDAKIRPGSLAVVCGLGDELTVAFAQQITQDLQANSKFTVLPQKKITEKFSTYPATIVDDPANFSDADKAKFAKIQQGLGVDYILVLWTYNSTTTTGSGSWLFGANLRFSVGGRLLTYPGAKEAGLTDFAYEMGQGIGRSPEETTHQMILNASKEFETEFLAKTGMAKEL